MGGGGSCQVHTILGHCGSNCLSTYGIMNYPEHVESFFTVFVCLTFVAHEVTPNIAI